MPSASVCRAYNLAIISDQQEKTKVSSAQQDETEVTYIIPKDASRPMSTSRFSVSVPSAEIDVVFRSIDVRGR